ncbi:protein claret segregational [Trichogramma pretiosum]|uniref:protein claret segregational n=1 Tax=Trichogramma pretiosum TaxID=7493 RepID=UPI0006C9D540|nr:protein claret segregational [Trichogramma pretiosum]XP_014229311.1 protein claret segregational [Trichogramma pretiosum]
MESRLPKANFQFKVPARTATAAPSSINAIKANLTATTSDAKASTVKTVETSKTMSATSSASKTDENKAPMTRTNTLTTQSRVNGIARGAVKRTGANVNNVIEPKRANLKTTMKPTGIRPVRPATTIGALRSATASGAVKSTSAATKNLRVANVASTATTSKTTGAKPSKWDLKGRLEYTNNELTALKQKHKDVTSQFNDIQEEIISLRESESTNRLKAETLEKTYSKINDEIKSLKSKIDELTKERDRLSEELKESKELYEETAKSLEEFKNDVEIKATLIKNQTNEIAQLKEELEEHKKSSTKEINELTAKNNDLSDLVMDLDKDRRALHNAIQELKGNIRVFCRIRPKIPKEASKNLCTINYLDECTLEISKAEDAYSNKVKQRNEFSFDRVFPPNSTQEDVFKELSMLVQSALEGYNVCVFAYGQTGSGKTYTMEGFPGTETEGMIPRTVKHIFKEMKHFEMLGWEYKIEASFLEIYNEQIVDLLDYQRKSHDIRMADSKGTDLYVTNLLVQEINSPEELNQCLLMAQENRAMAATQSNERSSRSHSVARIRLIGTHSGKQEVCIGNLNLVDLAGSERLKNEEAARIAETKNINKSLANLGHVILALLQKQDHIPYRNSKLTHLLMPSLGGNSKTLMLLNISPLDDAFNESLNSLRFGFNVNNCKTGTVKKVKTTM